MLDFPNAPTLGQKYPQPPVSGVPVYTWDGQKWTTAGSDVGTIGNVRYDIIQSLTTPQQAQGRSNLAINQAVALAATQDFNLVTAPGTYFTIDTASVNAPVAAANLYLVVELHTNSTFLKQTATTRGSGSPLIYVRNLALGVWGTWQQIMLGANNLSELTNIVTARQSIYAAPFDSMAYNGMQVNGGFEVSQELGPAASFAVPAALTYIVDGWTVGASTAGGGVIWAAQSDGTGLFGGHANCLGISTTTAQASMGANDVFHVCHKIEGRRVGRLAWGKAWAYPLTIAFWSMHGIPGLYSVSFRNSANTRSYVASYNQLTSNAQYNVITVPGCTDGVWPNDNSVGLLINFIMASGTAYIASAANAWLAGNFVAVPGQVNGVASTSTGVIRIAGVTILPGTEAPTSTRSSYILRPFDQELALCQRYYEKTYPYADAPGKAYGAVNGGTALSAFIYATTQFSSIFWSYRTTKRATPTFKVYSPWTGAVGNIRDQNGGVDVVAGATTANTDTAVFGHSGVSVGASNFVWGHAVSDARL